jgi:hypothetical protein
MQEPIDYERALQQLQAKRARRRTTSFVRRYLDLRPTSPGQVMLAGIGLVLVSWLIPMLHLALLAGMALLVVGFLTGTFQPRARVVSWRGRQIDLPPEDTALHRFYRILYRRPNKY